MQSALFGGCQIMRREAKSYIKCPLCFSLIQNMH